MSDLEKKLTALYKIAAEFDSRRGIINRPIYNYICLKCDKTKHYPDALTPIICPECKEELKSS